MMIVVLGAFFLVQLPVDIVIMLAMVDIQFAR